MVFARDLWPLGLACLAVILSGRACHCQVEDVAENKRLLQERVDINSNLDLLRIRDKNSGLIRSRTTSVYRLLGLRTFDLMTNPVLKQMRTGFPQASYGTGQLPTLFWWTRLQGTHCTEFYVPWWYISWGTPEYCYIFLDKDRCEQAFLVHTFNVLLHQMRWNELISSCDELAMPRCSWGKFLAFLDPYAIDYFSQMDLGMLKGWDHRGMDDFESHKRRYKQYGPMFYLPYKELNCYPIRDIDTLSALYIYNFCTVHKAKLVKIAADQSTSTVDPRARLCPNPCSDNPCARIYFATGKCMIHGFLVGEFVCQCRYNYIFDKASGQCKPLDLCSNGTFCSSVGTAACKFDVFTGQPACVCHPEFMGRQCESPNNACVNRLHHPALVTGNEACHVSGSSGNECHPQIGSEQYHCICSTGYSTSTDHAYSNCYLIDSPCSNHVCLYGSCAQSPDQSQSACSCEQGFHGDACHNLKGIWSQWTHWSDCDPPCRHGTDDTTRKRHRDCIGSPTDCHGPHAEFAVCLDAPVCQEPLPPEADALRSLRTWFGTYFHNFLVNTTVAVTFGIAAAKVLLLLLSRLLRVSFERWQMRLNPPNTMGLPEVVSADNPEMGNDDYDEDDSDSDDHHSDRDDSDDSDDDDV